MNESILSDSISALKNKISEVENMSENLAKVVEKELIELIKKTSADNGNKELEKPIIQFRVSLDKAADENIPTIGYGIMINPKEKFTPAKFVNFNYHFLKEDVKSSIGNERMKIAFAIKKAISTIMEDDFLVSILVENLWYNHITVDLR
jgi:hypothetical protein